MSTLEEHKMYEQINDELSSDVVKAYNRIPYSIIREETDLNQEDVINEFGDICRYYKIYKMGKDFPVEGTNGDYVPAKLMYKLCFSLINKEARFLFGEKPDITITQKGDLAVATPELKQTLTVYSDLLKTILDKNMFEDILLKGARDAFIGKRVACLVNFNEEDGVTISFIPSLQFLYETKPGNQNLLTKFVAFTVIKDSVNLSNKRVFKKKYTLEKDGYAYVEDAIYNGAGELVELVTSKTKTLLTFIPAIVILNDGLTGEFDGDSEIDELMDYELWYSKLGNADSDAQRKSMNPTKYVVDMDNNSTKNLSTGAGAFWDLGSDQNLAETHPQVGMLEPKMNYSAALKTTLDRIKTSAYEQVDMPNITLDVLQGAITSGKALKAIYWPLIVRCKEKMKTWGPKISQLVNIIIEGSLVYPKCILRYTNDTLVPVPYEVKVTQNTPLPEDEIEQKTTNLAEVESNVMSKKSYMKRWYGLTDDQVNDELKQMSLERSMLEDSMFNNGFNGDNSPINTYMSDDFLQAGDNAIKSDGTDKFGSQSQGVGQGSSFKGIDTTYSNDGSSKNLNGTQMSSLIGILNNYSSGVFNRNQAISLIKAMGLGETFANELLDEEREKSNVGSIL